MYLQKLVLAGFKSFANKTTLEFSPGVTAVVGPNGSGKSNIADSVRWVLGEQSLKTLRGKKSGDVIFAGSDKKTRLGYCQVDMHLNNEDHKAPVDFSEIVISRKIYRDGEGEYFINKNKVRLQDILLLLAKSNFGQRSYSIIGQGMVDLFLSATPTQRKEYFDEAAGVRQFQIKKEQAENKLSQTKDNLQQADLLIQEIEPRLRSLTRQVKRLERREEVNKQLKEIQHTYYSGLWHDLAKQHIRQEEQYGHIETKQKKATDELAVIQQKMKSLTVGESRQEAFHDLQKEYNQLVHDKNILLKEQTVLQGKKELKREQHGEMNVVWLERRQEQIEHELSTINENRAETKKNIDQLNERFQTAQKEQTAVSEQYHQLQNQLDALKNQLRQKKATTLPEVAQTVEHIYRQQQSLLEKIERAQSLEAMQTIKAEAKTVTSQLAQLHHKIKDTNAGDPQEILKLQDDLSKAIQAKEKSTAAVNALQVKLQIEQERNAALERQKGSVTEEQEKIQKELRRATGQHNPQELAADIAAEEKSLREKLTVMDSKIQAINDKLSGFNREEQEKKELVFSLQNEFSKKQETLTQINSQLNAIKVELAKIETKQEDLEKEMIDEMTDEERQAIYQVKQPPQAQPELFQEIQKLKRQLELIGGIDPQVSQEYEETKQRYDFLTKQSDDLKKAIEDLEKAIANLEETIKKQFNKSFEQINKHFTEYFKILFNGGNARLSMVREEVHKQDDEDEEGEADDEENHEEESKAKPAQKPSTGEKVVTGIEIHATPPGKKLRGIAMLSGGERALTSIALICAIIHNNPSPFVILDEVDAALDESNSIRFASIIERLAKKTQFIVVTHNRATMNKARILYGITMGDDGVSKLLSVNMEEAEKVIESNT